MNLALPLLRAAAHFSQRVGEIERENTGRPFGPFFSEIMWFSCACVLSSVAGLESYANELIADRGEKSLPPPVKELFADRGKGFLPVLDERQRLLDKFDSLLALRGVAKMNRGERPVQDVADLIDLRNEITHFKPEWSDEQVGHAELSTRLERRFKGSPFYTGNDGMFPTRWMTHAATKWAVESCVSFLTDFEARSGLKAMMKTLALNP